MLTVESTTFRLWLGVLTTRLVSNHYILVAPVNYEDIIALSYITKSPTLPTKSIIFPLLQTTEQEESFATIWLDIEAGKGGVKVTIPLISIVPSDLHITWETSKFPDYVYRFWSSFGKPVTPEVVVI